MTTLSLTSSYVLHSRHWYTATRFKSFGSRISLHILTLLMSHFGCPTLTGLTWCLRDVNPIYFLSVTILVTTFWSLTWYWYFREKLRDISQTLTFFFFYLWKVTKTFLRHTRHYLRLRPSNSTLDGERLSASALCAHLQLRYKTDGRGGESYTEKMKNRNKKWLKVFEAKKLFFASKWKTALKSD